MGEALGAAKGAARVDDDGTVAHRFCHAGERHGNMDAADHDEGGGGLEPFHKKFYFVA